MRWLAITLLMCGLATPVYAQFSIPGSETALTLSFNPPNPGPRSTIVLTLQSPLYDLTQSDISWTVDGKVVSSGIGLYTLSLTTGALGRTQSVSVEVTAQNGVATVNATVSPTSIDILWESDSYTPPFYKGRALPSAGSAVTLVAMPHFMRQNGSSVPSENIIYTWRKDGEVIAGASGLGKASARIVGPLLYGSDLISVEAISQDGSLSGEAAVRIGDVEPALVLYKVHPLFGELFHQPLGATSFIPEVEMTFAAVPYFAAVDTPDDPKLNYEWRVNETSVPADAAHPGVLTINSAKSSGNALLRLALTHATNYFMSLNDAWKITFTRNGEPAGFSDPFHP